MSEARVPCLAHNVLLHGAEKIIPGKENSSVSNKAETKKSKENTNTSTHAAVSDVHDIESSKGLLPIATLGVSLEVTSLLTLVHCDSVRLTLGCSRHSLTISAK